MNIIISIYGLGFIGAIVLTIWAIVNRINEKKLEKDKHKDYYKY